MKLLTTCPHMIPAERCLVLIFPAIQTREAYASSPEFAPMPRMMTIDRLERHGLDEIACGWEGQLEVTGHETPTDWYARGECPRCGADIELRGTD